MVLNKRIKRGLKSNFSFYLCSIFLTFLTVAFMVACISTGSTLKSAVNQFFGDYQVEDAEFTLYQPMEDQDIQDFEKDYGVLIEENRYKNMELGDATLRVFQQTEKVNKYEVIEGTDVQSAQEILITKKFATTNHYQIGDTISLGGEDFKICGYAVKADYAYMLESLSDSYRNNDTFGLAIVNEEAFSKLDETEYDYYGIVYKNDNVLDVRKALNDEYMFKSYMASSANTRISYPIKEGNSVNFMAQGGCPVFFIIVVSVIALVLSRIIKRERKLLGTFMALGYKKSYIIRYYATYGLIPGLIGSILGLLVSGKMTSIFVSFYIDNDFEAFPYELKYSIAAIIISLIIPTILYVLTAIIVVSVMLRKPAIELLNGIKKEDQSVKMLATKRTKISFKMQIRSMFGHKMRSFAALLGVIVASTCMLIGFNSYNAVTYVMNNGVNNNTKYEYQYVLNYMGEGKPEKGEGLLTYTYEVENIDTQLTLMGIDKDSSCFETDTMEGDAWNDNQYYLTYAASQTFHVDCGDTLRFRNSVTLKEYEVKISGIIKDDMHPYLYTGKKNAAEIMDVAEDNFNVIVSSEKLDNLKDEDVTMTVNTGSSQESLEALMEPIMSVIYIIEAVGFLLAVFVLYLIVDMVVNENRSTIVLLKILGLRKREISRMVLNTNHILVVLGFLIGMPIAYAFSSHQYRKEIAQYGMTFSVHINPVTIIIAFLLLWVAYQFSLFLLKRKAFKEDMVESLKDVRKE